MNPLFDRRIGSGRNPEQEGVQARTAGLRPSDCPYTTSPEFEDWLAGWAREDSRLARRPLAVDGTG